MENKYNIHPDFQKLPVINFKFSPFWMGLINAVLRVQRLFSRKSAGVSHNIHQLISSDGSQFKAITITPDNISTKAPALLIYHGGAFAITYGAGHLTIAEHYAVETGCVVVFVDYRLGPKYPFPYGFNDCYAALGWTIDNAEKLGIDPKRIAVGGDSAGGALAAGVAQKAHDEKLISLCAQLLVYPVMDYRCETTSATEFVKTPLWNAHTNRSMWQMYLRDYSDVKAPTYASPGRDHIAGLPPSYVENAEFDPLKDEALNYVTALRQSGIKVEFNETTGTVHGYDASNLNSELSQQALKKRVQFLQNVFDQQPTL